MSLSVSEQIRADEYWDGKLKEIVQLMFGVCGGDAEIIEFLRQIATDQREATISAIEKFYQDHLNSDWTDADLFDAIRKAEIKGE